jgi:geranylgeranyl pyrophosphate synthase
VDFPSFAARHTPVLQHALQTQTGSLTVEPLRSAALHLLGRGKLYRPLLVLATAEAVNGEDPAVFAGIAAATELIHTFTLIHDDLPCMDDAQLRRGVPTVHQAYGEATAVLAGDLLHSLAFESIATAGELAWPKAAILRELVRAVRLVIEGQSLDLQAEGRQIELIELEGIHRLKTGALLGACCSIGGLLAGAEQGAIDALREVGAGIGQAFQIRDDLLSVQGTEAAVGKSLDTDVAKAKATYPSLLGIGGAEEALASVHATNLARITSLRLRQPVLLTMMAQAAGERSA